jgi:hypothetical protein
MDSAYTKLWAEIERRLGPRAVIELKASFRDWQYQDRTRAEQVKQADLVSSLKRRLRDAEIRQDTRGIASLRWRIAQQEQEIRDES